jgi:hypothetical protein
MAVAQKTLGDIEAGLARGQTGLVKRDHSILEFFKLYDLIDTGIYWLNRDLRRCFVDEGKVIVIN